MRKRGTATDELCRRHGISPQTLYRWKGKYQRGLTYREDMAVPKGGFDVEMARVVAVALRTGVRENWRELRAIELQLDEAIAAFDGEDVLHPHVRGLFDEAKATLMELHGKVQEYTGPFELPEPDEEIRATIAKIVERESAHVPTR